jgi:hypothetical protein
VSCASCIMSGFMETVDNMSSILLYNL